MEWNSCTGHETSHLTFRWHAGAHSRISTLFATPSLLLTGGYYGELLTKRLPGPFDLPVPDTGEINEHVSLRMVSRDPDAITNHITKHCTTNPFDAPVH